MATVGQTGDDLFRQAIRACESAMASGAKMQEEYAKWMRQTFCNSHSLGEWYEKTQASASDALLKAQESVDEAIALFNQQMEASMKLMQKALRARQSDADADLRATFAEGWETVLDATRMNTQAMLKANSRFFGVLSEMAKKANGEAVETMQDLARKSSEQAEKMANSVADRVREMVKQAS